MNRRGFLSLLGLGATAAVIDPEKLLWVPDKKTIFIPPPPVIRPPRLMVGMARNAIQAGNYGYVQIYGAFKTEPQIGPSGIGYTGSPSAFRRVKAERDIWPGDIVYSDEVDYGNAPLWITDQGPDVMDTGDWMGRKEKS